MWVYRHNDCHGLSKSDNLGYNEIETNDCLVEEIQCGGGVCARDCQDEWCVLIVYQQEDCCRVSNGVTTVVVQCRFRRVQGFGEGAGAEV